MIQKLAQLLLVLQDFDEAVRVVDVSCPVEAVHGPVGSLFQAGDDFIAKWPGRFVFIDGRDQQVSGIEHECHHEAGRQKKHQAGISFYTAVPEHTGGDRRENADTHRYAQHRSEQDARCHRNPYRQNSQHGRKDQRWNHDGFAIKRLLPVRQGLVAEVSDQQRQGRIQGKDVLGPLAPG